MVRAESFRLCFYMAEAARNFSHSRNKLPVSQHIRWTRVLLFSRHIYFSRSSVPHPHCSYHFFFSNKYKCNYCPYLFFSLFQNFNFRRCRAIIACFFLFRNTCYIFPIYFGLISQLIFILFSGLNVCINIRRLIAFIYGNIRSISG